MILPVLVALLALAGPAAPRPWPGVDEAVVERVAAQAGRRPTPSPFEPGGDLKLFCFLAAGLVSGFALGHGWREVFGRPGGRSGAGGETAP